MLTSTMTKSGLILGLMFLLSGCGGSGSDAGSSIGQTTGNSPAPLVSLNSNQITVDYNDTVSLSWSADNVNSCISSGSWQGNKPISGNETIGPLTEDATFTIICTGAVDQVTDTVNISVNQPLQNDTTVTLSAQPTTVEYNGSTVINWSSNNSTSCQASGDWSGSISTSGSMSINSLTADSQFNIECSGTGGVTSSMVTVNVSAPLLPAPTVNISASQDTVLVNGETVISWSSTNADSCLSTGDWSGSKNPGGSQTMSALISNQSYTISCTGTGGTTSKTVSVNIVENFPGTALVSWTPPDSNSDGSQLNDLASYKIYYGESPGNYSESVIVNNPGLTSFLIENLHQATWYFAMTSINSTDVESSLSSEASKIIN